MPSGEDGLFMVRRDWITFPLGKVVTLQRGFDLPNRLRKRGEIPIVTSSGIDDTHNEAMVSGPGVVTGRYGTIGEVFFIESDFWPLNTTLYVRDFHGNDPLFISYMLRTIDFQTHSGKSGVPGVNRNDLHEEVVTIPPTLTEQQAIAEALSDADALIASLEQLIAKKRQVKQGAMQELLTGKRRLPGFSGDWEVRRLADECELITKGTTPTSIGKEFTKSGINFIKVESLDSSGRIISDKVAFIDKETNELLKRSQLKDGDLLISIAGALGRVGIVEKNLLPANTNQALAIARFSSDSRLNLLYVCHFLRLDKIKKHIDGISVQGAQANLSLQNIADLPIDAPDYDEQIAIATTLNDMDAEIAALEARLAKARLVKQGMMQELLSGRIRLI